MKRTRTTRLPGKTVRQQAVIEIKEKVKAFEYRKVKTGRTEFRVCNDGKVRMLALREKQKYIDCRGVDCRCNKTLVPAKTAINRQFSNKHSLAARPGDVVAP
ncbi:unnamed protein product [Ceratitis capitata]|uniref:(Mediterranean fruit fly) hypothetical protein n=1 Tax=Ceratitis capitata TaxID=7213 RepID=A0A811U7L6_CERCA|nr:unnamed protein product [Ceratitis capitata]